MNGFILYLYLRKTGLSHRDLITSGLVSIQPLALILTRPKCEAERGMVGGMTKTDHCLYRLCDERYRSFLGGTLTNLKS